MDEAGAAREQFVPATGCCSLCHYGQRSVCHAARQQVMDRTLPAGEHHRCEFYRGILRGHVGAGRDGSWFRGLMLSGG